MCLGCLSQLIPRHEYGIVHPRSARLFLLTNLPFFFAASHLALLQMVIPALLTMAMGIVSTLFHFFQCLDGPGSLRVSFWLTCDLIMCGIIVFTVIAGSEQWPWEWEFLTLVQLTSLSVPGDALTLLPCSSSALVNLILFRCVLPISEQLQTRMALYKNTRSMAYSGCRRHFFQCGDLFFFGVVSRSRSGRCCCCGWCCRATAAC